MDNKMIFNSINDILLNEKQPSIKIMQLINEGKLEKEPFNKIKKMQQIDQNKKYHPEGNVLNHTLLVVDRASENKEKSKDKNVFMWSALLHDIGKLTTTRNNKGRITSYNHDVDGEKIAKDFLDEINEDIEFNIKVSKLVRWHMQPLFYKKNLPYFKPQNMINDVEYKEVALLSLCDRLGRGNKDIEYIKETVESIAKFEKHCEKIIGGS